MLWNEFVRDDISLLINNEKIHGFSAENVRWMFTTAGDGTYQPLTWLSLAVDYSLWGPRPFGFHLSSLLLHGLVALVFCSVAQRLFDVCLKPAGAVRLGAVLATLLFAIHPLRVEVVAPASNRAPALATLFYLLSILYYLRSVDAQSVERRNHYVLSLTAFGCSLLSAPVGCTLPLVLLLVDWYPLKRLGSLNDKGRREPASRVLVKKLPFVFLAILITVPAAMMQGGPDGSFASAPSTLTARCAVVSFNLLFLIGKTLLPVGLSPLYATPVPLDPLIARFMVCGLAAIFVTVVLVLFRRRVPALTACWAFYVLGLIPVLGLTDQGEGIVADRSSYLPAMGFALLVGAWMARMIVPGSSPSPRIWRCRLAAICAFAVVVALGLQTNRMVRVWRNSDRLWEYCLKRDPGSSIAHYNLGVTCTERGDFPEAEGHYRAALALQPSYPDAATKLAGALRQVGRLPEAIEQYRTALSLNPASAAAHGELGATLIAAGQPDRALPHLNRAIEIDPSAAGPRLSLGEMLIAQGDAAGAIRQFESVVKAHPTLATARLNLAEMLLRVRSVDAAIDQFRAVMQLDPANVAARSNLAVALIRLDQFSEAISVLREGLDLTPDAVPLMANLARLLGTCPQAELRNIFEAIALAERGANGPGADDPQMLYTLATVYDQAGRRPDAEQAARRAIQLALTQGNPALARRVMNEFNQFPSGGTATQPVRRVP